MDQIGLIAALIGGLVILLLAGDMLVSGAASLARKLSLSPLFTGILIVGFGTSVPELLVSLDAVLSGSPAMALGNIVGSNIANIWLVLAVPAVLVSVQAGGYGQRSAFLLLFAAVIVWIGVTAISPLTPLIGAGLLTGLFGYIALTGIHARGAKKQLADHQSAQLRAYQGGPNHSVLVAVFVLIGVLGLPLGASLVVEGGAGLARVFDVPEEFIGLTLLAVGTSLPELAAAVTAAVRKRAEIVIGAIIGSNLFNLLGAGGLVGMFGPVEIASGFVNYDHWAMGLAMLTLGLYIAPKSRISRLAGVSMLLLYLVYLYGLVSGWNITAGVMSLVEHVG